VAGDFGPEDRLIGGAAMITATNSTLAVDAESNTIEVKGNNVLPTNSNRSMRYRLATPTSSTAPGTVTFTVTIGAI
jgi:hypothetical protein